MQIILKSSIMSNPIGIWKVHIRKMPSTAPGQACPIEQQPMGVVISSG